VNGFAPVVEVDDGSLLSVPAVFPPPPGFVGVFLSCDGNASLALFLNRRPSVLPVGAIIVEVEAEVDVDVEGLIDALFP
jgi:hypothetical protein